MKTKDIISLAKNAIKSNRLRANLTVAIIAIGITALIGIVTIIEVLKGSIYNNFTSMGANTFTITSQSILSKSKKHGGKKRINQSETESRISLQDADNFMRYFQYPAEVSLSVVANSGATIKKGTKKSNPNVIVMGSDEKYLKVTGTNLESGRNFTTTETASGVNFCILGNDIATKYFSNVEDAINNSISIGDEKYKVLGVMESKGSSFVNRTDNMVIIPMQNARQRYAISTKSAVISVWVNDIKYMNMAVDEAEGAMRKSRKLKVNEENTFAINKNDEIANSLISNLRFVTLSASLIGFITLLGAAIGLMNIMLVSVAERTREIGLSKAIGANSVTIRLQFLTEAIYISLKGGFIGITIGILIGNLISLVLKTDFLIPWLWIFIGFSICLVVGLLAGIYPAIKASKLNPINALRYE